MLRFKQFKSTRSADFDDILNSFIEFSADKLALESYPKITYVKDGSMKSTFGCYSEGEIKLNLLNRHPLDVLRTLAHEMVHYAQDLAGELHERSGEDGSDHENEANALAGVIMRQFGRSYPEFFNYGAILENHLHPSSDNHNDL